MDPQALPRKRHRYDWDNWADGQTWLIERGKDYTCEDEVVRNAARMHARNHDMTVQTAVHAEGLLVQFTAKPMVRSSPVIKTPKKLRRKS